MDAGRVAARVLADLGITQVAGVAGESFLPLLEGLREEGIPFLTTATEGGAAFLAIAHARTTGRPGFLAVTRGPGAANALIGVHEALQSEVPIVMIVGQIDTAQRSRQVIQEMEIAATFTTNAKVVVEVSSPDRVGPAMVAAYRAAMSSRRGPVVLSLPADMLHVDVPEVPVSDVVVTHPSREVAQPTESAVTSIVTALTDAERPLLVLGRPFSHHAHAALAAEVAHAVGAGVLGGHACADPYDTSDPLWLGCSTVRASSILGEAIEQADLILLLGHQLNDRTSQGYRSVSGRIIGVRRIPPTMWDEYPESENHCADPILTLRALAAALKDGERDTSAARGWVAGLRTRLSEQRSLVHELDAGRAPGLVPMTHVVAALDAALPERTTIVPDVGTFHDWFTRYLPFPPGRRYLGPTGNPMGYALPAGIGVQAASDLPRTVVLVGDGGFLMSLAELTTLARLELPVTVIVFVNGVWGSIARDQDATYGTRFGTEFGLGPDFAAVSSAFGVPGRSVTDPAELPAALAWALSATGPTLLAIRTDSERVSSADLAR